MPPRQIGRLSGLLLLLACLAAAPLAAQETAEEAADQGAEPAKPPPVAAAPEQQSVSGREARRVTGVEALEALVSNRTHYRTRSDGSYEIEYQSPDGISAYVWEGCVLYGEWWATADEICFFYPESELQGPHCFFIEKGEKGLEFWWSGNPFATEPTATTVKDVEGNVERLPLGVSGECLVS